MKNDAFHDGSLEQRMMKLSQIVNEVKTRISILEDENLFLRNEF